MIHQSLKESLSMLYGQLPATTKNKGKGIFLPLSLVNFGKTDLNFILHGLNKIVLEFLRKHTLCKQRKWQDQKFKLCDGQDRKLNRMGGFPKFCYSSVILCTYVWAGVAKGTRVIIHW